MRKKNRRPFGRRFAYPCLFGLFRLALGRELLHVHDEALMRAFAYETGLVVGLDLKDQAAAVNFGGEFWTSINKIIERAIVSARREGLIGETHLEEGAVAGAAREAISQIMQKGIGLNVGGKIGIARSGEHVGVALFFGVGLLHLNEVAVGLGHRAI